MADGKSPCFIRPSSLPTNIVNVYSINSDSPGLVLIINNIDFDNLDTRRGSVTDAKRLKNVFKRQFGFRMVKPDNEKGNVNLTVQEMKTAIINAVTDESVGKSSCFVLIILSHGIEGAICGEDSPALKTEENLQFDPDKYLSYKDIIKLLSNDKCKALRHKPKICFFQACCGSSRSMLQEDDATGMSIMYKKLNLPPSSDILMSFAAQDDYKTMRHELEGGIYARHLVSVLEEHAKECDLEEMLKFVERKVRDDDIIKEEKKEICLSTSVKLYGWSKRFYFYPIDQVGEGQSAKRLASMLRDDTAVIRGTESTTASPGKLMVLGSQYPEYLSTDGRSWVLEEDTDLARYNGICTSSNGKIFVFNQDGFSTWNSTDRNISVDPKTNFGKSRYKYAYAAVGEKIYIMGGRVKGYESSACFVFNSEWGTVNALSTELSGKTAVVLQEKIYVTPGTKDEERGQLSVLNPQDGTWNDNIGAPMKYPRCGHGMATDGSSIWIFGGKHKGSVCKRVEKYDFAKGEWIEVSPAMPTARENLSVTYFQGKFYAIGGSDEKGNDLDVVEIFDPESKKWSEGPRLKKGRSGHSSIELP